MHIIYFIPGLGADERLFSRLRLEGYDKRFIKWTTPLENETLPQYAARLSAQIDAKSKFSLVGASLGGMVAIEISKVLRPENVVLISSVKSHKELPKKIRFFRYFPIHLMMPESFIAWLATMNVHRFGIYAEEEIKLFKDMLYGCPAGYLRKAIDMVLNWTNAVVPDKIVHIHGENDRLFPVVLIKDPLIIKGGTHFMPYHNAEEVERIIKERVGLTS